MTAGPDWPWEGEALALARRIAAFVEESLERTDPARAAPDLPGKGLAEPFETLAMDIHRWQRAHDPVLGALAKTEPRGWREIPAIPVDLFKRLDVGTFPPGTARAVFRTSGTTGSGRGVHRMRSTSLYDLGSRAWFSRCVPEAPRDVVALLEDPRETPDSSLSHMVSLFPGVDPTGGRASWHVRAGVLERTGLDRRVRDAREPLFVAATGFALAEWLLEPVPPLPPGSVLMVTGGFKGRVLRLDGDALYEEAAARLAPGRIVTEYGMTELSSQLWGTPRQPFLAPPWLGVTAVDPATGRPLPDGSRGQLRFLDLCNLDSTLAIETMDEGVVREDGAVTLVGRLPGAAHRGCGLPVEAASVARRGTGLPGAEGT